MKRDIRSVWWSVSGIDSFRINALSDTRPGSFSGGRLIVAEAFSILEVRRNNGYGRQDLPSSRDGQIRDLLLSVAEAATPERAAHWCRKALSEPPLSPSSAGTAENCGQAWRRWSSLRW